MTILQKTVAIFEECSELSSIKQDLLLIYCEVEKKLRSMERVRKGTYAEISELKKENVQLKNELKTIKKILNLEIEDEKTFPSYDELYLF